MRGSGGADPRWWRSFAEEHPFLIHVTHSNALEGIERAGVLPSNSSEPGAPQSNWDIHGNETLGTRPGHSYFALPSELQNIISYYDDPAYLTGDDFVDDQEFRENHPEYNQLWVTIIPTSSLDPAKVSADEDSLNSVFESCEAFPRDPEDIDPEYEIDGWNDMTPDEQDRAFEDLLDGMKPLGQWAEEEMAGTLGDPEFIENEVTRRGTLAYRGGIPREEITQIVTVEEAEEIFATEVAASKASA